jgi:hypothetical protein
MRRVEGAMRNELRVPVLLTAVLLGLACSERKLDPNETPLEPLCMWAWDTSGHWADGTHGLVLYPEPRDATPYLCTCITEEQFWDEAEIERLEHEMNDPLLVECEEAASWQGFDWNECQEKHDSGIWMYAFLEPGVSEYAVPWDCGVEGWVEDVEPKPPMCQPPPP